MADRTVDEIAELCRAAKFAHRFAAGTLSVWKGDPRVPICSEPMMTLRLGVVASGGELHRRVFRVAVLGPVARMTMALHLGLTSTEDALVGLTADAAEADLMAYANEAAMMPKPDGVTAQPMSYTILPSDPRWIEGQRAAEPWRAPGKARRRG